ncbi:MAG TPA: VWA domain-containing protein [Thermoanaerobaculia bacterium]|nr:VWA domain-containing protein [Thermoanaerobaculia bacterium]
MRKLLLPLLLLSALSAAAQDIAIRVEPLGDTDEGVVARVTFRFVSALEASPDAVLSIQGSFLQDGKVIRNFRYRIPEERPSKISTVQTFPAGNLDVEVRLMQDNGPEAEALMLQKVTADRVVLEKTGKPYVATAEDGAEAVFAEGVLPERVGAVMILPPQRDVAPNLFIVNVDVQAPVVRVEFFVEGKKILARNAPPYRAELDLGKLPKRVEVRAVGYDKAGRYVDADAFIVNERETPLEVKITRTETPDAVSHFKLSVMNPKGTNIRSVTLYAGDQKLIEWDRPPYALDLPTSRLAGVQFVRAAAIDETGYEASDLLFLDGQRYMETMEVNLVELPVSVSDRGGAPIGNLEAANFTVLENAKPMKITNFNFAANLPISVGVLIDHSGSMEKRMDDVKAAAGAFFRRTIKKNDRAFIAAFATDPSRNTPFVSELATLEAQVDAIPKPAGGTALYDSIVTGLYRFRNVQGRKALIVLTDGEDTTSRLAWNDMLAYARASRVPLYFIGIGYSIGNGAMKTLAAETGGVAYFVRSTKELDATYGQLENDLRSQYLLSYYTESSKNDQAYRSIEVKVDRPDARVRTIRGFIP